MRLTKRDDAASGRGRSAVSWRGIVLLATLAAIAATFGAAPGVEARTDEEQFLATLGRAAPFEPAKAKLLCRCTSVGGAYNDHGVGMLRTQLVSTNGTRDYGVFCVVPEFDSTSGALHSTRLCLDDQFEILPK